jgi:hypothetical protein
MSKKVISIHVLLLNILVEAQEFSMENERKEVL